MPWPLVTICPRLASSATISASPEAFEPVLAPAPAPALVAAAAVVGAAAGLDEELQAAAAARISAAGAARTRRRVGIRISVLRSRHTPESGGFSACPHHHGPPPHPVHRPSTGRHTASTTTGPPRTSRYAAGLCSS